MPRGKVKRIRFMMGPEERRRVDEHAALEASLARLGTDYVDLYYLAEMPRDDEDNGKLEEWVAAAAVLVRERKIRGIGLSEASPAKIRAAHAVHPLSAVQQEWSAITRNLETSIVPCCVRRTSLPAAPQ